MDLLPEQSITAQVATAQRRQLELEGPGIHSGSQPVGRHRWPWLRALLNYAKDVYILAPVTPQTADWAQQNHRQQPALKQGSWVGKLGLLEIALVTSKSGHNKHPGAEGGETRAESKSLLLS